MLRLPTYRASCICDDISLSRSCRVYVVALVTGSVSRKVGIYVHSESLALFRCVDHALVLCCVEVSSHPSYNFTMFLRWIRSKSCALICGVQDVWSATFVEVTELTNYGSVIEALIESFLFWMSVKYARR